ncbi:MAG: ParB/RepB/Spo0J family partition protein [Ilumatobacteraceae bacterium]
MTTTEPATGLTADTTEPELCWLDLAHLAPHPDNPRTNLGDLSELVRSINAHGILEPLVVLPADGNGMHLIVAGHRRHAAGLKAGVVTVPVVVRPMTPAETVEAMLSENVNRSDLTVAGLGGIASDASFGAAAECECRRCWGFAEGCRRRSVAPWGRC